MMLGPTRPRPHPLKERVARRATIDSGLMDPKGRGKQRRNQIKGSQKRSVKLVVLHPRQTEHRFASIMLSSVAEKESLTVPGARKGIISVAFAMGLTPWLTIRRVDYPLLKAATARDLFNVQLLLRRPCQRNARSQTRI